MDFTTEIELPEARAGQNEIPALLASLLETLISFCLSLVLFRNIDRLITLHEPLGFPETRLSDNTPNPAGTCPCATFRLTQCYRSAQL
jgi:hypothetical protein